MVLLDSILITLVLLNFYLLGVSRMNAVIGTAAIQGILLGTLPMIVATHLSLEITTMAILAIVVKGVVFPVLLFRAMREVQIRREVEPLLGYVPTLLLGALGTGASIVFCSTLPLIDQFSHSLLIPAALSTVITGFLILTTRAKAISQVVGYLVLENGIFMFGLTLISALPLIIELGALLDLLVGVFVMGIILNHIQRTFSSLDTTRMTALRD